LSIKEQFQLRKTKENLENKGGNNDKTGEEEDNVLFSPKNIEE
jgi:hypothetical protein